jgi:hypothetical protein
MDVRELWDVEGETSTYPMTGQIYCIQRHSSIKECISKMKVNTGHLSPLNVT